MGGVALMVAALWLPWHRSGGRVRNAFELFDAAERLDLGPGALLAVWRWIVAIAPVLAAIAWLAWLRRVRWAVVLISAAISVVVGTAASVLIVAPGGSRIGTGFALVGSVAAVSALTGELWSRHRREAGTPTRDTGSPRSLGEDS